MSGKSSGASCALPSNGLPADILVFERGWLSSNNILLLGPESCALVDSGYVTHSGQTLELVRRALGPRKLGTLVNTHLHSDHCGGNAALQLAWPGLRTLIPAGLAPQVREWDPVALTYEPTGQQCPRFGFDDVLVADSVIRLGTRDWQVHAAPGHDPHSVILFDPASRTLLSADALWQNGFGVVFPELEGEQAFAEVGATLDLIEMLQPALVVPGHGSVFDDVDQALARARKRLDGYVGDPKRHAWHAGKVLIKFKLLEWQALPWRDLLRWAETTPYFGMVHDRCFPDAAFAEWVSELLADLVRSGAARREGELISNG